MIITDSRVKNKNIVIWGVGILQSDLQGIYEFPTLLYYVDDNASEENMISVSREDIHSPEKLLEEDAEKTLVILCTDDQEDAISRLKKMGFQEDNYIIGDELLVQNSLYQSINQRNVSIWGIGTTYSLHETIINHFIPDIDYFIVTNKEQEFFRGKKVFSLDEIKNKSRDSYIIVASIYYREIFNTLLELGMAPGKDFIHIRTLITVCSLNKGIDKECQFEDRKKDSSELLVVLAGYKEFVWESVFQRLQVFIPQRVDVCIVTSGIVNEQLKDMCEKRQWSYLSTSRNNVSLAINTAIWKHPRAKYIYKMDEDIFLTQGVFDTLKYTYLEMERKGRYEVGFVTPLIPINGYGYVRLLEIFHAVELWEERFGELKYTDNLTHHKNIWGNPETAKFMWGEGNPEMNSLDKIQEFLSEREFQYSICPIRYSIGFILFHRNNWVRMGGFPVLVGNMGMDEEALCQFCMMKSRVIVVSENSVVGHLSFGPQNKEMEEYYNKNKEKFLLPLDGEWE